MRKRIVVLTGMLGALGLLTAVGCGETSDATTEDPLGQQTHALVHDRSFAVTDFKFLQAFPLEKVLHQLVSQAGIPGMTELDLFQQFWDTQNPAPGAGTAGPHCDDETTWQGASGLNEFPWECPRLEGFQAGVNPFGSDPLYIPVGLFNRFDLAPANGSHCGEHRIVYAMQPGHKLAKGKGRNFIIFEAILPNPNPQLGLAGCLDVAKFWADLSFLPDPQVEANLVKFYYHGISNFAPVIHVNHYGLMLGAEGYACSTGQIRTNQFNDGPWTMREYKLTLDCRCGPCHLTAMPMTVKSNPYPDLFNVNTPEPLAPDLQVTLASQIGSLSTGHINGITYSVDDSLNAAESPIDSFSDYLGQAFTNGPLHNAIQGAIPTGSTLNSQNIIDRALTQSCAGCHLLSDGRDLGGGLTWPNSLGFVHIGESLQPNGKYPISQGLEDEFIPFREKILLTYLDDPTGFTWSGAKCESKLPPELEPNEELCAEAEAGKIGPKELLEPVKSQFVRSLRTKWEGGRILGRSSGH